MLNRIKYKIKTVKKGLNTTNVKNTEHRKQLNLLIGNTIH